jgi:hypothetical protein
LLGRVGSEIVSPWELGKQSSLEVADSTWPRILQEKSRNLGVARGRERGPGCCAMSRYARSPNTQLVTGASPSHERGHWAQQNLSWNRAPSVIGSDQSEQYRVELIEVRQLWQHTSPKALAFMRFGPERTGYKRLRCTFRGGSDAHTPQRAECCYNAAECSRNHDNKIGKGHKPIASGRICTI